MRTTEYRSGGKRDWRRIAFSQPLIFALLLLAVGAHLAFAYTPAARGDRADAVTKIAPNAFDRPDTTLRPSGLGVQPAPDAPTFPFLRLAALFCSGIAITAARLARKFRQFWGLGVFSNVYCALFILAGAATCGIPVTAEHQISSLRFLGSAGSWIADLSGVLVTAIIPVIGIRSKNRRSSSADVRDLGTSTTNAISDLIEDGIRDHILLQMQKQVVAAARKYDWEVIKVAARRAVVEERVVGRLRDDEWEAIRSSIENLTSSEPMSADFEDKYEALVGFLRWCSFKRLIAGLIIAETEIHR